MALQLGQPAPEFSLTSASGETVKLSDYRGKYVVLYFYPKDMTPTCTTQACDFRDAHDKFTELDAVILGVSTDPVSRHQKFVDKYGLPFVLLSDTEHEVAEQYDVWQLKKTFGREYMGIVRSTFIIGKNGELLREWRKVKVKDHVEEALSFIKEQQDQ